LNNNVLITGGAGFIGLHLAKRLLDQGYQVQLVDNFARGVKDKDLDSVLNRHNISITDISVLDENSVLGLGDEYEIIFHLAAIIGVDHVMKRPYMVLYDNLRMLGNMISLAKRQNNLLRFLFASTSEVYAGTLQYFDLPLPTPEDIPLTIADLSHPRTSYMLSKICGEYMCKHAGIPYTIFRPHNIYGPRMGMSHVIPELFRKASDISQDSDIEVYSVDHRRTFCYIEDAIEELVRMVESEQCINQTLNLGNQSPEIEIGQLAKIILKIMGKKNLRIKALPGSPGSPVRRCPDMAKANRVIGYEAKIDIEEGIAKTYSWYVENIFEGHGVGAK